MNTQPPHQHVAPHAGPFARQHALHRTGVILRLAHWRDRQLARQALRLAGEPWLVLDLPCGTGCFWPLLAEKPNRVILAAEHSARSLEAARYLHVPAVIERVYTLRTSALAIDLGDVAVDCIFCMCSPQRMAEPAARWALLKEFHRVTRDTLIVALPVRGCLIAWRWRHPDDDGNERFVLPVRTAEAEFAAVGFTVLGARDFIPGCALRRVYTLRKRP